MRHQAIERLLPAAFQRAATPGSPLRALLEAMDDLHAPDEAVLESIEELFVPYGTRDAHVAFLAGWLALDHILPGPGRGGAALAAGSSLPMPVGRLRNLVAEGARLAQWRGTPTGLIRTLEIATGVAGFSISEPPDRPFHFVVHVPPAAADQLSLVQRVISTEKPAATTAELVQEEGSRP